MRHAGGEGGPSVADRVFVVLESCAASHRALSLADLVERTGLPKTTLHRVCWKLVELGMLDHGDDGFRIGTKLFALGGMNPRLRRLRAVAMPYLHALATHSGWVVNLAIPSDGRALIVEEVFGRGHPAPLARMCGATMPLHATAIGKALLAGLDEDELGATLGDAALKPFTRSTIVRPSVLREHLAGIRGRGVAFSHQEWRLGTSGVAAPVVADGETVAAVAVVCRADDALVRGLAAPVRRTAQAIARDLAPAPVALAA